MAPKKKSNSKSNQDDEFDVPVSKRTKSLLRTWFFDQDSEGNYDGTELGEEALEIFIDNLKNNYKSAGSLTRSKVEYEFDQALKDAQRYLDDREDREDRQDDDDDDTDTDNDNSSEDEGQDNDRDNDDDYDD